MLDFGALICILKPMTCITCSIDLLYLIKTSRCRWVIFVKEILILHICPSCFNIQLFTTTRKIFDFTGCSRNSEKFCSNACIENVTRDTEAVKWHPYNVEVKIISFVK